MDPRVLDAMLPFQTDLYGNPHSKTHAYGWEAEKAVDDSRTVSFNSSNFRSRQLMTDTPIIVCRAANWSRCKRHNIHIGSYGK